jgi:hypothetical protein
MGLASAGVRQDSLAVLVLPSATSGFHLYTVRRDKHVKQISLDTNFACSWKNKALSVLQATHWSTRVISIIATSTKDSTTTATRLCTMRERCVSKRIEWWGWQNIPQRFR